MPYFPKTHLHIVTINLAIPAHSNNKVPAHTSENPIILGEKHNFYYKMIIIK